MSLRLMRAAVLCYATNVLVNSATFLGTGYVSSQIEHDEIRKGRPDAARDFHQIVHMPAMNYNVSLLNPAAFYVRHRIFLDYGDQFVRHRNNEKRLASFKKPKASGRTTT